MDLVTPGIGLIFWTTLFFLILLFILGKFAWPAILTAIRARNESIKQALDSAEKAKQEMAKLQSDNQKILAEAKAERDAKSAEIMKKYKKAQEDRESEKPKPKQEYIPKDEDDTQSASDRLREAMLKIAKPNYSDEIIRIAECLKAGDDKLIKKVRSFIIQNTHPDKTKNDVYKESYLKLTEVK